MSRLLAVKLPIPNLQILSRMGIDRRIDVVRFSFGSVELSLENRLTPHLKPFNCEGKRMEMKRDFSSEKGRPMKGDDGFPANNEQSPDFQLLELVLTARLRI
jgi:hypothetical protein